jgi:hypothetical protein
MSMRKGWMAFVFVNTNTFAGIAENLGSCNLRLLEKWRK